MTNYRDVKFQFNNFAINDFNVKLDHLKYIIRGRGVKSFYML